MIYGYARVSTVKQMEHGSSLADQRQKLIAAGVDADNIYSDTYTGTKMDRPNFTRLLAVLQPGDTLIVTKLDRFARTVVEGSQIVQQLHEKGININILNMFMVDDTPIGNVMVNVLLAFAQFERDMIVERTQTGRAVTGNYGGRPKKHTKQQLDLAMTLLEENSYNQVQDMTGISKSTLIREHNRRKAKSV